MTTALSRRGLVARLALALPLIAGVAACHPTPTRGLRFAEPEEGGSDAELLALGEAWQEAYRCYRQASVRYGQLACTASDYIRAAAAVKAADAPVRGLEARIADAAATTLPGLLVKARVAGQLLADECEPDEALTAGLVRDLLALTGETAAPTLLSPGALA